MPTIVACGQTPAAAMASSPTPEPMSRNERTSASSGTAAARAPRDHGRAAAPALQNDWVGERPARRSPWIIDQIGRLVQAQPDQAGHHLALRAGQLIESGQAGRGRHGLKGVHHGRMARFRRLHQRQLGADGGERFGGGEPAAHRGHDVFERHRVLPWLTRSVTSPARNDARPEGLAHQWKHGL